MNDDKSVLFWLTSILYCKVYPFTQPEFLVRFYNQHGMYSFRYRALAEKMREL